MQTPKSLQFTAVPVEDRNQINLAGATVVNTARVTVAAPLMAHSMKPKSAIVQLSIVGDDADSS